MRTEARKSSANCEACRTRVTAPSSRGRRSTSRRGLAIILVLGIISITMAVSYAILRGQAANVRTQVNGTIRLDARQAAYSGLSAALRKMSQTDWGGADSVLTGTLGMHSTFIANYTTGDASLSTSDPQAADWPYRVTVSSTGYIVNPVVSYAPTSYKVEAVVRLTPRSLATNPSVWSTSAPYVVYQTVGSDVSVQLPVRIDGPVRLLGALTFCATYPTPTTARSK